MTDSTTPFEQFVQIIARLRDPVSGCPWDKVQTHQTLKPYLIEESYETLEAIDQGPDRLADELGDVLLQVVLHSQIAKDAGTFDVNEVISRVSARMIERHPHVFGDAKVNDVDGVLKNWERIKQESSAQQGEAPKHLLDGIPKALPALLRAQKIGDKVKRVDFDWASVMDTFAKVAEEVQELGAELQVAQDSDAQRAKTKEEFGDLLFALAQLARKLNFSAEEALQEANTKFTRRFNSVEDQAGANFRTLGLEGLSALWDEVKRLEKSFDTK